MRLSIKRANIAIGGTGYWLPKQSTTSGKIRVENEDGLYIFTSNTVFNAVRRCLERDKAAYDEVKETIRGKSEKARKHAPR